MNRMRRLTFSVRDMFWMIACLALIAGWYVDHVRQQRGMETLFRTMRRETPWLVETDEPDWGANALRLEAQSGQEQQQDTGVQE